MIAIFEPNQQASSLYTETESLLNSHLQIEPDTDRQLLKKNASEDSDTLDFNYLTGFGGDQVLIEEAKAVSSEFIFFLRRTFKNLTTLGNELWGICNKCVDSLGKTEGKAQFNRWLKAEFGKSQNLARAAMSLSQWYNTLSPAMQRLVAKNVKNWSVAALKKLTSLTDELVAVLVKSGKQTEQSIERAIATSLADELTPLPAEEGSRPVTPSDWSSLRKRFNLRPRHIKVLKQKAESLASLEAEAAPVVKVSHVNEAIAQCKEDPEILSQPLAKKDKKNKTFTSAHVSNEALTEVRSAAIAGDMEKDQAANFETSAKLQQALAEKNNTRAAQEEQINNAIAGEQEKAAMAHSQQMESLRQALEAPSPPVEERYTQEQLDEAIARDRSLRKDYRYTFEDIQKEIADARSKMYTAEQLEDEIFISLKKRKAELRKEMYTFEEVEEMVAEARAEMISTASTADAEKLASLQQALAEKERASASLEEQNAAAVASARALMEKERDAAVAQARADEREKMASAMAEKIASLEKKLAERDDAIASYEEEKVAAVAEARADERASVEAEAIADIEVLQREIESLKAQNHSLMATRGQLVTATSQVEELKSQLADTEGKYQEKVRWLEADINRFVQSNQKNGEMMKMLEEANKSMHHENRDLKEELAGYKKIETKIQSNYSKIAKAESLQKENTRLRDNLEGQTNQSVLLASRVNQLSESLNEILYVQRSLAKKGIPGFNEEEYVSPLDGQTYQGIKGLIRFIQDLINNDFQVQVAKA